MRSQYKFAGIKPRDKEFTLADTATVQDRYNKIITMEQSKVEGQGGAIKLNYVNKAMKKQYLYAICEKLR